MAINIVLMEPEIPQNTGNIARTCAATGSSLHLIKPLGFSLDNKHLKRAGLDYWNLLDIYYYDNYEELVEKVGADKFFYATTKGHNLYTDMKYHDDCYIIFGKETKGIPEKILNQNKERCIKIPMINNKNARSLNLANSVNIVVYEALRQIGFPNMG
ncbi:tRNA (uridine(34)/cytosine(34)/5-carboxymethylaminomethyluridine(34)-2'-O)-methyltransferase TrmL [Clostridium sp. D2Q-14]|uniref:tRNA (uridine(34)/cytosine(34)/5- carboxymethylaminomethyluridine(34)-2'-O)- methyltransferase TrmL n=1 Tax=Anaeromonas gelatinilytica TaxID=2683194 RepID=UPI00193AE7B4|nr:tRNA (uridine(34)/cytosine(34)/5-carboxymethylaminomethyluridine(34)-2'-O)-methyltransferase TrmL [Anaeromonas gelatinilytica]MBS4536595.1 tRNA (uridine(34)/cytosine(34)/5-carboxymethylaminomethyluridine(34)-2'-O)-methyltransferase TrmL [Anaeromonas gelatinilytica]